MSVIKFILWFINVACNGIQYGVYMCIQNDSDA